MPPQALVRLRRLPPSRWLLAVVAGELITLYVFLNGGGWVFDDNLYLELARKYGTSWRWLTSNYFGHWAIGHRVVFSVQNHLMPVDYRWGLVVMLLLLGISAFLLDRSLRLLVGDGWIPLLAAGWFGMCVILIRPLQWWSSGLQSFPTLVCDLLCLYAYLRYQRERSARWVILAGAALSVGLLFYEKPIYMLLYLALVRVVFLTRALQPLAIATAIWRERRIWIVLGAVACLWAIGFIASGGGLGHSTAPITASEWLRYGRILWVQTLVPAAVGLTFPPFGLIAPSPALSAGQTVVLVALELVLLGAVVVSLRRRASAWRAWAALVLCVVANGVLVGEARLGQFGSNIGGDPRYALDLSWLVPLFVCLAFGRSGIFAPDSNESARERITSPYVHRIVVASTTVAAIAYLGASVSSVAKLQRQWPGHAAREWEQNVQGKPPALAQGARVVVADDTVPGYIVGTEFAPYSDLSLVMPHYRPNVGVDGPLVGRLVVLDAGGHMHAAAVARPLVSLSNLASRCTVSTLTTEKVERSFARPSARAQGPYYALIHYASARNAAAALYIDHGTGYPRFPDRYVSLQRGSDESIAWLGPGSPRRVVIESPVRGACMTRIDIVTLRAMK